MIAAVFMGSNTDHRRAPQRAYRWEPGSGPDADVLARLAAAFPRPAQPMGEAWFMGEERRMFTELLDVVVADAPSRLLDKVLEELATGPCSFGPQDDWRAWYLYLLPRVLPIALARDEPLLADILVTATISQFPGGLPERGPFTGRDVADTLGRVLLDASRWHDGKIRSRGGESWDWARAAGELSPFLFLVAKTLEEAEIEDWVQSLFRIADPRWRALLLCWLAQARPLFGDEDVQPAEVAHVAPGIEWADASRLNGNYTGDFSEPVARTPFLPLANKRAFRRCVARQLASKSLDDWRSTVAAVDDYGVDLGDVASAAAQAYRANGGHALD